MSHEDFNFLPISFSPSDTDDNRYRAHNIESCGLIITDDDVHMVGTCDSGHHFIVDNDDRVFRVTPLGGGRHSQKYQVLSQILHPEGIPSERWENPSSDRFGR